MTENSENIEQQAPPKKGSRKKNLWITTIVLVIIAITVFFYWLFVWRLEQFTDDSYVEGNKVQLTTQIAGTVTEIYADDTEHVEKDQILIELDDTDYKIAYEQSKASLGETTRQVVAMFERVRELKALMKIKEAELIVAEQDYQNRTNLIDIGGVSKENFEHIEGNLRSAKASLNQTFHALLAAEAMVLGTTVSDHPLVKEAASRVKKSYVDLMRTKVRAPVSGIIGQRSVQLGELIDPSRAMLSIIPLDEIWVTANFKEVQLSDMRIGQRATVTSDCYGGSVTFHGRVIGVGAGSGNVFSILPPQNATGNWIKIVQRIPVRISLDPEEVQKYPLVLGMSMNVTVDIRDKEGYLLTKEKSISSPIYQTDVYKQQIEGVNKIIQKIIQDNE